MSPRMRLIGQVKSNKMDKTVVVTVSRKVAHPKYRKTMIRTKKYYVQSDEQLEVGTPVVIEESRRISKLKKWRVAKVLNEKKSK